MSDSLGRWLDDEPPKPLPVENPTRGFSERQIVFAGLDEVREQRAARRDPSWFPATTRAFDELARERLARGGRPQ